VGSAVFDRDVPKLESPPRRNCTIDGKVVVVVVADDADADTDTDAAYGLVAAAAIEGNPPIGRPDLGCHGDVDLPFATSPVDRKRSANSSNDEDRSGIDIIVRMYVCWGFKLNTEVEVLRIVDRK